MLTDAQINDLTELTDTSLNQAEVNWNACGRILRKAVEAKFENVMVPSQIPGYTFVKDGVPIVDEFICLVLDMRKSTDHLMCQISKKVTDVNTLQRIYFETSALLPASAKVISYGDGNVTEYLGDGVLALFQVDQLSSAKTIRKAYNAAVNCLQCVNDIINPELNKRYSLPPISIGIGMALSKAMVTVVGTEDYVQPKAFGECVFYATKLSKGTNMIHIDKKLRTRWPNSDGGQLQFNPTKVYGQDGFSISKKK